MKTAVYAHALGIIRREIFGQECDAERLAVLAVYHDAKRNLTGDLPTPIKYHDRTLRDAYKGRARRGRAPSPCCRRSRGRAYESAFTASEDEESSSRQPTSSRRAPVHRRAQGGQPEFLSAEEQTRRAIEKMHLRRQTGLWSTARRV